MKNRRNNAEDISRIFEEDTRLYKYYINDITNDSQGVEFIRELFNLELIDLDKSENSDLLQLYEILGFDKFFEVIAFFESKTIKFPKLDKIKKLILTAISYYQVEILGLSPKDAGKILSEKLGMLNLKQKNIKGLIGKLQKDIDFIVNTTLCKMFNEQKNSLGSKKLSANISTDSTEEEANE